MPHHEGNLCNDSPPNSNKPTPWLPPNTSQTQRHQISQSQPQTRNSTTGKKQTQANLKIASLNIRGDGSAQTHEKWQHINQIMREHNIGILAVQETHLTEEQT
jgi:hypothetical protein